MRPICLRTAVREASERVAEKPSRWRAGTTLREARGDLGQAKCKLGKLAMQFGKLN